MVKVFVGLGSNLGDRKGYFLQVIELFEKEPSLEITKISSIYESKPEGLINQPDFYNSVIELKTSISAQELFAFFRTIEQLLGREWNLKWGPRTIDLDILLYGNEVIKEPNLEVPHPRMTERSFVLVPLLEIAPDATLPDGRPLKHFQTKLIIPADSIHKIGQLKRE